MKSEWYQCCYTNATHQVGGTLSTGWQQVSVSDDIPPAARQNCKKYQSANSSNIHSMVDEDGNILNLLEITGDGVYLYIIRTQYGLNDAHGRANIFSHAYILPCADADKIGEPNTFLTIADENFVSSEAEAEKKKDDPVLKRIPDFSIEGALGDCGLSDQSYLTLVWCVYIQIHADNIAGPLYIEYNGSGKQLRELLYLIYSGLPLYARRRLSIISCPKDGLKGKDIVFTKNAEAYKRYLVPKTGENSILTEAEKRKLLRLGYLDHAVSICHKWNMGKYYEGLENIASQLGDPSAADQAILRIANKLCTGRKPGDMEEEELTSLLKDALRSNRTESVMMTNFILFIMKEFKARKYEMTASMKALLLHYADNNQNRRLQEIADKYRTADKEADAPRESLVCASDKPEGEHLERQDTIESENILEFKEPENMLETEEPENVPGPKKKGKKQEEADTLELTLCVIYGSEVVLSKKARSKEELSRMLKKGCIDEVVQRVPELNQDKRPRIKKFGFGK